VKHTAPIAERLICDFSQGKGIVFGDCHFISALQLLSFGLGLPPEGERI